MYTRWFRAKLDDVAVDASFARSLDIGRKRVDAHGGGELDTLTTVDTPAECTGKARRPVGQVPRRIGKERAKTTLRSD